MSYTMNALILEKYDYPFRLTEIPVSRPGKNEVLVKIHASGVNPLDIKIKRGQAAHAQTKLPAVLGMDLAGVIEEVGEEVSRFRIGDEVYGMSGNVGGIQGSLAEYATADPNLLAFKPSNLTMREAAAIPLAFITAWEGLVDRANVQAGKKVLIHGGAGGVGHIAIQLAKAKGAEVFATVVSKYRQMVENYRATPVDYIHHTVAEYVAACTDNKGFDIILDVVGGTVLDESFTAVKQYCGHVISILGWGTHNLAPLSFRGATYSGVYALYPLLSGESRERHGMILQEATLLAESGKLVPRLDPRRFTLSSVTLAHTILEERQAEGKIIIDIL